MISGSSSSGQLLNLAGSGSLLSGVSGGGSSAADSAPVLTIREKQKDALKVMLNLNLPISTSVAQEPVWKLFIYDRSGQDIVSPLLSIKELRDLGVTLHMQLHSDRDAIPDVPAVYFVMPTDENIMRICQDFRNHLYDYYYLNFIAPISRAKLEELATVALQTNCSSNISKVVDQYLNYISLEDDVFALKHADYDAISYYAINRPAAQETEIEAIMGYIVDSLFSVFVTLGVVPVIRAPKGNAAEMVAEKLDKKIRENLRDSRNSFFSSGGGSAVDFHRHGAATAGLPSSLLFSRPLLVILDRSIDLATPLAHSWTYQALAHDVLDMKQNQVIIEESAGATGASGPSKKKSHDLNPQDKFWAQQKGSPFPQVAEAIQERLDVYRNNEDEVKRLKSEMGLDNTIPDQAISLLTDNTAKLTNAINTLPELLETKRLIDLHTTIASAILEQLKARKLDVYFEVEEKLTASVSSGGGVGGSGVGSSRGSATSHLEHKAAILELIRDPAAGTAEDKLRLFLVYYLTHHQLPEAEVETYLGELREAAGGGVTGEQLAAFEYLRRYKKFMHPTSSTATTSNSASTAADSLFQSLGGGTRTVSMFSKLMSQGSQFVMEGVKNLVVKRHTLPVTRVVDALMEARANPETDDFRHFDPKVLARAANPYGEDSSYSSSPSSTSGKTTFQDAIVFVVGGGNYIEYQNLVDYCKSKSSPKRIIYGTTELMNATRFLAQLCKLANEAL